LWFSGAVIVAYRRIRRVLAVDWTERVAALADPDGRIAQLESALAAGRPSTEALGVVASAPPADRRRLRRELEELRAATARDPLPSADDLIHLALIPTYTESLEKLRHTVRALAEAAWPT